MLESLDVANPKPTSAFLFTRESDPPVIIVSHDHVLDHDVHSYPANATPAVGLPAYEAQLAVLRALMVATESLWTLF